MPTGGPALLACKGGVHGGGGKPHWERSRALHCPSLGWDAAAFSTAPPGASTGKIRDSAEPIPAWALQWEGAPRGAPGRQPVSLGPHKPGRKCFLQKIVYSAHFLQLIPPPAPGAAATEDGAARTQRHFTFCSRGVIPCPSREASGRTRGNSACSRPPGLPLADGQIPARASLVGVLRAPTPPPRPPSLQQGGRGTTGLQVPTLWGCWGIAKPSLSTWARAPSPVLGPPRLGPRGWSPAWTSRPQGRQSRLTPALGLPTGGGGGVFLSKPGAEPGEGPAPAPQLWQEGAHPEVQDPWNLRHSLDPVGGAGGSW